MNGLTVEQEFLLSMSQMVWNKRGAAKNARAAPLEKGTLEMLSLYALDEIEEKEEEGDMNWFRQFGRVRAQQLFQKMKALKGKGKDKEKDKEKVSQSSAEE